jgi:hypothetical protein
MNVVSDGKTWLESSVESNGQSNHSGWNWKKTATMSYRAAGNELQMAIPRTALGLSAGTTRTCIDFKWADNLQRPGDVMDFYISGDVAPEGRFKYRYEGD